ncbi:sigma 54-interacting transcriptional regulator [Sorangium sp. So ce388]|uniref:sigma 54-interacting transcriptional regulator n=1 Tax=Sorangium sp. So ce388 TaxID=3133309 RepID=UPI003F5B8EF0
MSTLDGTGPSSISPEGADGGAELLPVLTVLYHPRLERVGQRAVLPRLARGAAAQLSRLEPAFVPPAGGSGEPLGDAHLSRRPIRILQLGDGRVRVEARDTPTRLVAQGEPLDGVRDFAPGELRAGIVLELGGRIVLLLHLGAPGVEARDDLGLVGHGHLIERARREIRRLADLDVPVLIRGETGVGKELVAHALHREGPRGNRAFVTVNMAAIPPSLAGAELFGVERGAFTGSTRAHGGYFGAAEGGTLFLDEVGETPPDVQPLLLRALDTGEVQPIGGSHTRQSQVRVIAATDADLETRVRAGAFRAPLLHRLASYELTVPPLRDRRDDIGRLLVHFLGAELGRLGEASRLAEPGASGKPWLPASLVATLARYDWPGNVRQLRNVVRQLAVASRGGGALETGPVLARLLSADPGHLSSADHWTDPAAGSIRPAAASATALPSRRKPSDVSEEELLEALRACRWDFKSTAERLRISRTSLYALVEASSQVRRASDIDPEDIARCYRECEGDVERAASLLKVSKHALQRRVRELRLG